MNTNVCTIDFESRSACDIKTAGGWKYAQDPTTEILCLAFRLPDYPDGHVDLWHPAFPQCALHEEGTEGLAGLFDFVLQGGLLEAHNAFFERGIWQENWGKASGVACGAARPVAV